MSGYLTFTIFYKNGQQAVIEQPRHDNEEGITKIIRVIEKTLGEDIPGQITLKDKDNTVHIIRMSEVQHVIIREELEEDEG